MTVVSVAVTEAGRALAARLPFERAEGGAAAVVRALWDEMEGFVLFLATGAAVRIIAPLLGDKASDPAVVCVDEAGRHAVALVGGHAGGANDLARRVAALLGCEAVVTTASDASGSVAIDQLPGFFASGDVAGVGTAVLDGRPPLVVADLDWPLPRALVAGAGPERVVVSDRVHAEVAGTAVLHPPSLVLGVGTASHAPAERVRALVDEVLAAEGLSWSSIAAVATIDRRASHPALTGLGRPVVAFDPAQLAAVEVPTPSDVVAAAVGTPSVAEAAALLAGGAGSSLVVTKRSNDVATVAVVRRRVPAGHVVLVGLGPGGAAHRTPAAEVAVRRAEVVIGYGPYVDQAADLLSPHHSVIRSPIGSEVARAKEALAEAGRGRTVAMVCSGDAGVYAMASIVAELAPVEAPEVGFSVVPGITAALAASAALGAPLGHDHVMISLSDLLTPWEAIERRVRAAADTDLVVAFYNPRSRGRTWQLPAAIEILRAARPATTPVGVVTDAARDGEAVAITDLASFDPSVVGMTTCVIVGASTTRLAGGRLVTPRGYTS